MQTLLITDRHGQDHTGKSRGLVRSFIFFSLSLFLGSWPFGCCWRFSCSSFYHVSSLHSSFCFVVVSQQTGTHTHTASSKKEKRKNATSIMACQLSKPLVCCALELTSPTFTQPKPPAPPCPQPSALFLLWVSPPPSVFVVWDLYILIPFTRTHLLAFWNRLGMVEKRQTETHTIIEICSSPFFLIFYFYFLFSCISFGFFLFSSSFVSVCLVIFLFSRLVYLSLSSSCASRVTVVGW